uniref:Uncharacterized protein n=1 Tax=Arundo donax TaxID=35708 RepID=A0A0A9AD58_ARUDO
MCACTYRENDDDNKVLQFQAS